MSSGRQAGTPEPGSSPPLAASVYWDGLLGRAGAIDALSGEPRDTLGRREAKGKNLNSMMLPTFLVHCSPAAACRQSGLVPACKKRSPRVEPTSPAPTPGCCRLAGPLRRAGTPILETATKPAGGRFFRRRRVSAARRERRHPRGSASVASVAACVRLAWVYSNPSAASNPSGRNH